MKRARDPKFNAFGPAELRQKTVADYMARGFSREDAEHGLAHDRLGEHFVNAIYHVHRINVEAVYDDDKREAWPAMVWLSIKRHDRRPIHDWRDLQRIKNALVGPDHEGVELYPSESRVVDTANQYHLWVLADANARFPFGWTTREIAKPTEAAAVGARQRAFEEGVQT